MQEKNESLQIDINNYNDIKNRLSNKYSSQKLFIEILKENINLSSLGNKEAKLKLEKMDYILEKLIKDMGIAFCDLINNNKEIIDYYCQRFLQNPKSKVIINILVNYIDIYNYISTSNTMCDDLINFLEKNGYDDAKNLRNNKRIKKTEIESFYDDLSELYIIWKNIREIGNNMEEDAINHLLLSLKEKKEKMNEIEKNKTYPNFIIEFLNEKIKKIEDFKEEKNNNLPNNNLNSLNTEIINNNNNLNPFNIEIINNNNNLNNTNNSEMKSILNSDNNLENVLSEEELKKLRETPLKDRTSFYKNEILSYGEDELTEFKNYIYPFQKEQEKELKRQYIGFLNSNGGRIYIGVDDHKKVRGVVLTYNNCDTFRNTLVGYSNDFYPKCRLEKIKVYFIPVRNSFNKNFINNLYIVKIIILPGDPYSLYSVTNKSGFISAIRKQSQVFNLTAEEITKEIIDRNELKKNLKDEIKIPDLYIGFNDPEPERNIQVHAENKFEPKKDIFDKKDKKGKKIDKKIIYIVYVKNIDKNLKVREINKHFNGCGCSYQKFYSNEGKSLGYGKISFVSEDTAKAAIAKYNGDNLGGKKRIVMSLRKSRFFNKINK